MSTALLQIGLRSHHDIVVVRQRSRQIAAQLGFGSQDQTRIATAVSEAARIACTSGGAGRVVFSVEPRERQQLALAVRVETHGRLAIDAARQAEMTAAFGGACRLMDWCDEEDGSGGVVTRAVTLGKYLGAESRADMKALGTIGAALAASGPADGLAELAQQNKELVQALAELRQRQEELMALTRELEDTNRGVVALYAEIEEKADRLRRADEMKTRFLSNTSHELRTPLSSIRALSQLLLDRLDGELTAEQERQVNFIKSAAIDLSSLVNDLLDLAKIEAGKVAISRSTISVSEVFGALRGMMRPLVPNADVRLVFDDPQTDIRLCSDEGKLSQILRNLVSNALKFTESGEVRIHVALDDAGDTVQFMVSDTGIGIDKENLPLIFEEFVQVENRLQQHGKGTGLGLPLCQKLARLLGGDVAAESEPGTGSVFTLTLPREAPLPAADSTEIANLSVHPAQESLQSLRS